MRTPMEHTGFPTDETLAAFVDGRLDGETRRRVIEHMADCADCRDAYLGAQEWAAQSSVGATAIPSRSRSNIVLGAGSFAIAASLALVLLHAEQA